MENIIYNSLGGNSHTITFTVDTSLKDKVLKKDINDYKITFIDDAVREINNRVANIIVDYNYEIISKTQIDMVIVFKHIFKSMDAGQKYIKMNVLIDHDANTVSINPNPDLKLKLSIPSNAQPLEIVNALISFDDSSDYTNNNVVVKIITTNDVKDDKCFNALVMLIRECILEIKTELSSNTPLKN